MPATQVYHRRNGATIVFVAVAHEHDAQSPSARAIKAAFDRVHPTIVLVEGAGSASEVNLRDGDIANFGFARAANVPVVLIGDIHRGGVIASIVGALMAPASNLAGAITAPASNIAGILKTIAEKEDA